ncbi:glycoside hydrolase family 10 protein [Deinococcus sp. KSM4-11]|uniref:glycoside hydrolase family 10 protein n=1 Tax=Deinococcus sp. KSM4-11 TaxID=2568654 RepID=UPI0010A59BAE|nr:glycoside hydrolase family 10 protein [Deinococcus sp. KSM4-11]
MPTALRRALLCSLLLTGVGMAQDSPPLPTSPAAMPVATPASALRGLWVDAFGPGLKTRAQAQQTVDDAARLGVNTLFVQAIRRADCLCLNSTYPAVTDKDLEKGFDPLAVMVKFAHARGMRVIAWVSVTGAANITAPNSDPRHVFRTHGPDAGAQSWLTRRPDGTWQEGRDGWLDVALPDVQDYVTQGIVSLVKNYAVDGVQLDRIRYPDGDVWGYVPAVLDRYRAETGATGTPAVDDAAWADWKRQQVTNLVRRIALEVKAVRSSAWVSAATITYLEPPRAGDLVSFRRTRTYWDVLQDWPTWMNEGLLDLNVLMNYKRDTVESQAAWFDGWNAFAQSVSGRADGARALVAAGSAMYLNPPEVTAAQAVRAVNSGLGWVGYSYRTPTAAVYGEKETGAQGLDTVRRLLTAPGAPLAMPAQWTAAPPTLRGLLGRVTGTALPGSRAVEAWQGGHLVARGLTDALGYYGFATLKAGAVEVRVAGQRWTDSVPPRGVVRLPYLLVRDLPPLSATPSSP